MTISIVQVGRLPFTGRPLAVIAPTPRRHRQQEAGRRYGFRLPTSVRSVGEISFAKSVFAPTRTDISIQKKKKHQQLKAKNYAVLSQQKVRNRLGVGDAFFVQLLSSYIFITMK
jgi:hypothetical protein